MNLGPDYFTYPVLYREMVKRAEDGALFAEVGCFYGRSSRHMCSEIQKSGKKILLHCIDLWGDKLEGQPMDGERVYEHFKTNMKEFEDIYVEWRGNSWDMAQNFNDGQFDFVFIDADHSYESVKKDIEAWMPKVKKGGVLAGHDIHHPPVREAVTDCIGDWTDLNSPWGEGCWFKYV